MANSTITSLTKRGYQALNEKGLVDTIKFYSLGDSNQIYTVNAVNNVIPKITGDHTQITSIPSCGKAQYDGIFANTPTTAEIVDARSRAIVEFNRIDCTNEFVTQSLNLRVNLNSWFNQLNSATYSFNMVESLNQTLWDYISVTIQTLDLSIKDYTSVNQFTNTKFSYVPASVVDFNNYQLFSPKFVVSNGKEKRMVNKTGNRFPSPFLYHLSTNNVQGDVVNATNGSVSLVPGNWGYWANGNFVSIETLETSDSNNWDTIYPAVQINNAYYYLPINNVWNTTNGLIGYMLNMVNVDGSGETALTALINSGILFMKSSGTLNAQGAYEIPITFNVNVASNLINNISNVIGNTVTVNFSYDPNNITSDIIERI